MLLVFTINRINVGVEVGNNVDLDEKYRNICFCWDGINIAIDGVDGWIYNSVDDGINGSVMAVDDRINVSVIFSLTFYLHL